MWVIEGLASELQALFEVNLGICETNVTDITVRREPRTRE
jgi:hypothetical protein